MDDRYAQEEQDLAEMADFRATPAPEPQGSWTIIDVHTNESFKDDGDPVLFDTQREALTFAVRRVMDPRRFVIVHTDDIINEEV